MGGRADRATWVSWLPPTRKQIHILTFAKESWTIRENGFPDWCIPGTSLEPLRLQSLSPFRTPGGFSGQREARPKPHTSQVHGRYKPGASQEQARSKPSASQVHARYMRGTSHPEACASSPIAPEIALSPEFSAPSGASACPSPSNGLKLGSLPLQAQTSRVARLFSQGRAGLRVELAH